MASGLLLIEASIGQELGQLQADVEVVRAALQKGKQHFNNRRKTQAQCSRPRRRRRRRRRWSAATGPVVVPHRSPSPITWMRAPASLTCAVPRATGLSMTRVCSGRICRGPAPCPPALAMAMVMAMAAVRSLTRTTAPVTRPLSAASAAAPCPAARPPIARDVCLWRRSQQRRTAPALCQCRRCTGRY
jgi:hypothetical protein